MRSKRLALNTAATHMPRRGPQQIFYLDVNGSDATLLHENLHLCVYEEVRTLTREFLESVEHAPRCKQNTCSFFRNHIGGEVRIVWQKYQFVRTVCEPSSRIHKFDCNTFYHVLCLLLGFVF